MNDIFDLSQIESGTVDFVYAEFYPDKDKLMQLVLDTFYTKQDK